ncbi:hypothetical protein [Burkholderia ubonensis]|uniref:hypothetical protein n=1 Tax=Burkholderia ubonensis TaxID=101571 RepID=UPI001E44FBA5|nr:hypothetical protein [Burkholderia ubonensis]
MSKPDHTAVVQQVFVGGGACPCESGTEPCRQPSTYAPTEQSVIPVGRGAANADNETAFPWKALIDAIAKVLSSLAWPVAAAIIAFNFRSELSSLLERLKSIKAGKAEAVFSEGVKHATSAAEIPAESEESPSIPSRVIEGDPRGSVLSAWIGIETQIVKLYDFVQPTTLLVSAASGSVPKPRRYASPMGMLRDIKRARIMSDRDIDTIQELGRLRNEAAHAEKFDPKPEIVLDYVRLADDMVQAIKRSIDEFSSQNLVEPTSGMVMSTSEVSDNVRASEP